MKKQKEEVSGFGGSLCFPVVHSTGSVKIGKAPFYALGMGHLTAFWSWV